MKNDLLKKCKSRQMQMFWFPKFMESEMDQHNTTTTLIYFIVGLQIEIDYYFFFFVTRD